MGSVICEVVQGKEINPVPPLPHHEVAVEEMGAVVGAVLEDLFLNVR